MEIINIMGNEDHYYLLYCFLSCLGLILLIFIIISRRLAVRNISVLGCYSIVCVALDLNHNFSVYCSYLFVLIIHFAILFCSLMAWLLNLVITSLKRKYYVGRNEELAYLLSFIMIEQSLSANNDDSYDLREERKKISGTFEIVRIKRINNWLIISTINTLNNELYSILSKENILIDGRRVNTLNIGEVCYFRLVSINYILDQFEGFWRDLSDQPRFQVDSTTSVNYDIDRDILSFYIPQD